MITEAALKKSVEKLIAGYMDEAGDLFGGIENIAPKIRDEGEAAELELAVKKFTKDALLYYYRSKYGHSYYERKNDRLGKEIEIHVSENPLDM